jgi:PEP-CTERM motif
MTRMRKSIAVLSSAIAPILLAGSHASAGVNVNLISTLPTEWPNSTIGAIPVVDSGTSTAAIPGGPTNSVPNAAETMNPGVILAETFTTPNTTSFKLGAISFEAGGGGPTDTTLSASLELFQLNSQYTPTSGFYTLGNGGSEVGSELLGVGSGGALPGLAFNLHASNNAIYEFDFSNNAASPGGSNDQVTLLPNTSYAIELWGTSNNTPQTFFQRASGQSYTGGQAYALPASDAPGDMVDMSTQFRGQATGTPFNMLFAVYSNSVVIPGPAFWNVTSSGNWNVASNWSSQSIPNGIGVEADFLSSTSQVNGTPPTKNGLTANGNVFTDTPVTVGTMNFDNSNTYVLDGAGSLTVQVSTGSGAINVLSGTQEINLPLTIASNTAFNVSSGATLNIADPMTVNAGISVTTPGTGTINFSSIVTLLTGASLAIHNSTFANTLSLASGSTATLSSHGVNPVTVLQLNTLSNSGKIDLSNNAMIVHGGNLATVTNEIAQGRGASGAWTGTVGITSSAAAAAPSTTAVGVEVNDNGHGVALMSSFEGQPVADGDILVKYTYVGDANLSGAINASDYTAIDNGFNLHMSGWSNGDFNYDGVVNGDDYTLIDNAFNTQGTPFLSASAGPSEQIASAVSAVPEPGTLSLLAIGGAAILGRRRRRV